MSPKLLRGASAFPQPPCSPARGSAPKASSRVLRSPRSPLSQSVFFNTTKTIFTVSLKRTFPLQHIYKEVCLPVFSATLRQRKQVFSLRENKNTQQITASVSRQHFQVALPMIPKSASELFSTFHKNTGVSITSSLWFSYLQVKQFLEFSLFLLQRELRIWPSACFSTVLILSS